MLDKVIEQLGQVTQQKIADAVRDIHSKTDAERSALVDLITETHDAFAVRLDECQKSLTEAINDVDTRREALYVEETQQVVEKLQELEVIAAQLATIKNGEDGEKGEQGLQGEPGLDRPLLEPVQIVDKDYPKSTLGLHNGGLWISTKDSVGCPESDPHAWSCILDSMTTMSIDLQEDHTFKLSVRMATGKLIEDSLQIPYPEHKGIWEAGEYKQGQIVTKGSSFWQAMEDTAGEPPGNGWKQILTAPRGKVGPAGKSIEGKQGKPGRNGMDAKLPPNFVDDLIAIASERKAFEDGRSGAEAITSFRGYFMSGESYSVGDVVNDAGALLLCKQAGSYTSVAASSGAFEVMVGIPSGGGGGDYLKFRYEGWNSGVQYQRNEVVFSNGWTMVANKGTTEYPFPLEVGDLSWAVFGENETPTWTAQSESTVRLLTGLKVISNKDVAVSGIRVWIPVVDPDVMYQVVYIQEGVVPRFQTITPTETGWFAVTSLPELLPVGLPVKIYLVTQGQGTSSETFTHNWSYRTSGANPSPSAPPTVGQFRHYTTNAPDTVYLNKTDNDGIARKGELDTLQAGDTIAWTDSEGTDVLFTLTSDPVYYNSDVGEDDFYELKVSPPLQQGTNGNTAMTFTHFLDRPTSYVQITDQFAGEETAKGLLSLTGSVEDEIETDNAYGIDVLYQEYHFPDDWNLLAGSRPEQTVNPGQLSEQEASWVQESASPFDSGAVVTTGGEWTEVGREHIPSGGAVKGKIVVDARRTDAVDYHSSELVVLAYNDGGITEYLQKDIEIGKDLSVRTTADGDYLVVEVKGKNNQVWDWKMTAFYRSIV